MTLSLAIDISLTGMLVVQLSPPGGAGPPDPPAGFVYLTDDDGSRLTDDDGAFLMEDI